ncbi:hypothetical protein DFJ74DRAFT_648356 [Hyaloraphidium curvatum]|nr:hypothetical protein DFJ74DRAFT_648356 [Hyaloraphidium curvatum]
MIFEIPEPKRSFLWTDLSEDTAFVEDSDAPLFQIVLALDPRRTWSGQVYARNLANKRPADRIVPRDGWWRHTKLALMNGAPVDGQVLTLRITFPSDHGENGGSSTGSVKLVWLVNLGDDFEVVLGELDLSGVAHPEADVLWVRMMSDAVGMQKRLVSHNAGASRKLEGAESLRDKALKEVESMRRTKAEHEDVLYLKFREVLNSKKRKIRLLMDQLDSLRNAEHDEEESEESEPEAPSQARSRPSVSVGRSRPSQPQSQSVSSRGAPGTQRVAPTRTQPRQARRRVADSESDDDEDAMAVEPEPDRRARGRPTQESERPSLSQPSQSQRQQGGAARKSSQAAGMADDDEDSDGYDSPGVR